MTFACKFENAFKISLCLLTINWYFIQKPEIPIRKNIFLCKKLFLSQLSRNINILYLTCKQHFVKIESHQQNGTCLFHCQWAFIPNYGVDNGSVYLRSYRSFKNKYESKQIKILIIYLNWIQILNIVLFSYNNGAALLHRSPKCC